MTVARQYPHGEKRLLLVEDDEMLGQVIEEALELQDYRVTRCTSINEALTAIQQSKPDLALLDINIHEGNVFPVADSSARLDVPFLFATAAHAHTIPSLHANHPLISKPFLLGDLSIALKKLTS